MVQVIDNTEPEKPITIGTIFKNDDRYYMIVAVIVDNESHYTTLNLQSHVVNNHHWSSIEELIEVHSDVEFFNNKDVALVIDEYC